MTTRRRFLGGALAAGLTPARTWADAGSPGYLSAARMPDGSYRLFGLDAETAPVFSVALPGRGHAAACHPRRPEAVAFARRPGTFAYVLDCANGSTIAPLTAPPARHFYGHGAFSDDGTWLFTTENAYEIGEGRIGVWAADDGYRRVGEFPSGGTGPHDIVTIPGRGFLAVANGGIDTHPETGREKLNIPTMQPNLAYMTPSGGIIEKVQLEPGLRLNSIRHLAVRADGLLAFGCQWQGAALETPALVGMHRLGTAPQLLSAPGREHRALNGYVGSIAFLQEGDSIAVTAPRGGRAMVFDIRMGTIRKVIISEDICGVAGGADSYVATTGTGRSGALNAIDRAPARPLAWDNHLVRLPT